MKRRKSDWVIVKEAEEQGLMVAMGSVVKHNRTPLNIELGKYFKEKMPNYLGSFDEDKCDDILFKLNTYLKQNHIDKHELNFTPGDTNIYLIPITDNLQLEVELIDEYYGDGVYSKYVAIDYFLINENTTKQDVDKLIDFIHHYLA